MKIDNGFVTLGCSKSNWYTEYFNISNRYVRVIQNVIINDLYELLKILEGKQQLQWSYM